MVLLLVIELAVSACLSIVFQHQVLPVILLVFHLLTLGFVSYVITS